MVVRGLPVAMLLSVLALAGCGAESADRQAHSDATVDPVADASFSEFDSWGVAMAEPELKDARRVSLAGELSAFSRPRRPSDEFLAEGVDLGPDSAEGRDLPGNSRLLLARVAEEHLDELGAQSLSLYAVPTDRGWVCAYVVYDDLQELAEGAACEHGFVDGLALELQGYGRSYRLYGVVEDGVTRAWVRIGDRRIPVRVGGNGFFFEAKTTEVCPVEIEAIVVERHGETTEALWSRLAPALAGASGAGFGCG
jgi:hypothetical protein